MAKPPLKISREALPQSGEPSMKIFRPSQVTSASRIGCVKDRRDPEAEKPKFPDEALCQYVTTVRMLSPRRIRSKPSLI